MSYLNALELVIHAARQHAQMREDDADASNEERMETAELWEAIETITGRHEDSQ